MEKVITGVLEGYWEQGMEGRIEYAFLPDDPAERFEGKWPILIADGQYLKIYKDEENILWEGEIKLVARRRGLFFPEKHDLPNDIWSDFKQKGVPYKNWIAWFWQKPPYRAELTLK